MKNRSLLTELAVLLILITVGSLFLFSQRGKNPSLPRNEIPPQNQEGLEDDNTSVRTLLYGYKIKDKAVIGAINDSGKNNTPVSDLPENVKFIIPLVNGRELLYLNETDDGDLATSINLKKINGSGGLGEGQVIELYKPDDGYRIDRLVISEDNKWIAWYEIKPPTPGAYTHVMDSFRSFKAELKEGETTIRPTKLTDETAGPNIPIHFPVVVTNTGEVYFDITVPSTYEFHSGFTREDLSVVLAKNKYNSKPYLFSQRYLLYSSFDLDNSKIPSSTKNGSTREEVLNTNILKVYDLQENKEIITAAPGDDGEQYKHPIYISGSPDTALKTASVVYKIDPATKTVVADHVEVTTREEDGTFDKLSLFDIPTGEKYRILATGELPNGRRVLYIGKEVDVRGNLGAGWNMGLSGYKDKLSEILVFDVENGVRLHTIKFDPIPDVEFIGVLRKSTAEKIGIERNLEVVEREKAVFSDKQLQLQGFVPIEPKRERKNPRSDCENEWQAKGYPNYEACEACPIYVYSPLPQMIKVVPKTPINTETAFPALNKGVWEFMSYPDGTMDFGLGGQHRKIDFIFPRKAVEDPSYGWVVKRTEFLSKVNEYARNLGFNAQEREDIVDYFKEVTPNKAYIYLSHLEGNAAKEILDFEITPHPSSIKTVLFYIKGLDEVPSQVPLAPEFSSFPRSGVSVITWGTINN